MQSKAQIDQILRQKSDAKEIPGVVAMAATGNDVIYQGAAGKRDLGKDDAMTPDSVFWIASMTKAITTAAGMQLVEQGSASCCPTSPRRRCWTVLTTRASRSCGLPRSRSRCGN
jgi:methyl acetate hydrolase